MPGHSPKLPISAGIDTSIPASERYRILGRIASGGMAEIYLARMVTSSGQAREVVLKRLMPELQADHEFVQMFYDEARIASQMRHPNIVQIYELGELDGSLFISMELLRGMNLRDLLTRLSNRGERLPFAYGVKVATGALEALAYAHRFTDSNGRLLNVVHRDVSPQNIIVTYDGVVKLVDFGVAKAEGRLHQTRAGLIKGKFAYMSPEQISGGKIDARSDQFALAEVFYELFLRRHPFYASSDMEVLRAILDADPPHPSTIDPTFPPPLGAILMRALRKHPAERYPNTSAMLDAFEGFLGEQRMPVTNATLAKFVRDLFADRIDLEKRARESGDERLLIDAMAVGRAEPAAASKKRTQSRPAPPAHAESEARYLMPSAKTGPRDRVVEIARTGSGGESSADKGAPAFIAHSGYTDPGVRKRRFQSQIHRLFDDPAEPTSVDDTKPPLGDATAEIEETLLHARTDVGMDDGEMPTIRGVHVDQIPEVAIEIEKRRREPDQTLLKPPSSNPNAKPRSQPISGPKKADSRGPKSGPQPSVTHRSQTMPRSTGPRVDSADRWGLFLFVAGLGALLGAIIYAVVLYLGSQAPVMRLEVRSTPAGAAIVFDGVDTAQQTPTVFQNIASNREHTLELRLKGYQTHTQRLAPAPEVGEMIVNWTFRAE